MKSIMHRIKKPRQKKIKTMLMNKGLRFRLVFFFALVSLLPLLILGFFSYYKSSNTIKEVSQKYSSDIINEINTNMLLRFKNINDIGKILLNNNMVINILSKNYEVASDNFEEDRGKMGSLLKFISESNENIRSVYILSNKNSSIYAAGDVLEERGLVFFNDEYKRNYKDSTLFTETVKSEKSYIWWPTQNVLGKNVFILTEKLYNKEKGVLGILVVHLDVSIMDGIYNAVKSGRNSEMYLMDGNGRILFHPNKHLIGREIVNDEILKSVSNSEEGSFFIREKGNLMFAVYNTFSVTWWKAIVIIPYKELISDAIQIRNATIIIFVSSLLFIILSAVFVTKSILNPMHRLMELMKKGSTGDMKVRFSAKYKDEIGQLGDSFNKMMADIEKLIQMVGEESQKKVEAEIRALEAHINPHFLYNTLASIYWGAMAEGNTEVGKMAASLSKFFKFGLNKGKEFTTIEREVEHVREYLSIQHMMYKNMFSFEVDMDSQVAEYKTIKLILQPLVENSLVHGIEKRKEKGYIKVKVEKQEKRIVFKVWDNGVGIEQLDKIGIENIIENGYGLKNICERLRLYFNNDFTINCKSDPIQGTTFEISIPAIADQEVNAIV